MVTCAIGSLLRYIGPQLGGRREIIVTKVSVIAIGQLCLIIEHMQVPSNLLIDLLVIILLEISTEAT